MTKRKFGNVTRLPSGKYRARYTGPDGVMHKAPKTFFEKDDATGWLRDEQKLIEFDMWTAPDRRDTQQRSKGVTVGEWMEEWLRLKEDEGLKGSTLQNYRSTVERRILKVEGKPGELRKIALSALSTFDVVDWWDAVTRDFGKQPFNHNAYLRLSMAMDYAVERGMIALNPVRVKAARKKPKPARKEMPDTAVMDGILRELPERYRLIGILTLYMGLRIGEALGLRRMDIDLPGKRVWVRGNCWRKEGVGMVRQDTPKTDPGNRPVPLFDRFLPDVRQHLKYHCGDDPEAMLFTTGGGKIVMDTTYRACQNAAKRRAGYSVKITPHYGRVWLITTLAELGMTPPAIGEVLGQEDLQTITEVYMRATDESKRRGIDALNKRLGE